MNAKQIISELNARRAEFVVNTNIMYSKGINGVGFDSYIQDEKFPSGTKVYRTFEPNDDCLVVVEKYEPRDKESYSRRRYIGYDKITYITAIVED